MSNKIREEIIRFGISELRANQILKLFEQMFKEVLPEKKEIEPNPIQDFNLPNEVNQGQWNKCRQQIITNLKNKFDIEI